MKNHARAQNAQLMQSKMSAMAKLAAGGGNGGEQLRGPQVQNLNDMMVHKNRALAGATILGDGRVGLILDVNTLVNQESQVFAQAA